MSKILIIFFSFLGACTSVNFSNETHFQINEFIIKNSTNTILQKVKIKVVKNHSLFSCSNILSGSECSSGFPVRPYEGNKVDIVWQERGSTFSIKNISIHPDKSIKEGSVMKAVIEIQNNKKYMTYFIR